MSEASHLDKIGFMQGRLSPIVDGKIQSFPWKHWDQELRLASENQFHLMEWTLDHEDLYLNPLMTKFGRDHIKSLCETFGIKIRTLTGDFLMQAPFYKIDNQRDELLRDLDNVLESCSKVGIGTVCLPLVDTGSIQTPKEYQILVDSLLKREELLRTLDVKIVFESDFEPHKLKTFIAEFPKDSFGINYDMGNSASFGFDPSIEFESYGERILNVHIKDRLRGGTTVPLGEGDCNFSGVREGLQKLQYNGLYILQTARSTSEDHIGALNQYREFAITTLMR